MSDTQPIPSAAVVSAHGVDVTTLTSLDSVTFGRIPPRLASRRLGWWFYAEYRLRTMRSYWHVVAGYGVLTPVLYLLAMGLGLGTLVDGHTGGVQGVGYLTFVGPSLLVTSLVMESVAECTYTVMDYFRWSRVYLGVASTPLTPAMIVGGEVTAVSLRMTAQAVVFWLILVISGSTASPWSWLTIPIGVLASMSFGTPLLAFSATRERDDSSISFIERFIIMPMFLFAGTFFPLESMPRYLQWIGWFSPMWHGTELARAAAFHMPLSPGQIAWHLGFLVGLFVVGYWLAAAQFRRRLTR